MHFPKNLGKYLKKMGNSKSGRWHDHQARPVLENCITLSVSNLKKAGKLSKGVKVLKSQDGQISVSWSDCNYGGQRAWLHCPQCKRRSTKLFKPNPKVFYKCRQCWNLTYRSSNFSGNLEATRRLEIGRIHKRIGLPTLGFADLDEFPLIKPPHIHCQTFSSAYLQFEAGRQRFLLKKAEKLKKGFAWASSIDLAIFGDSDEDDDEGESLIWNPHERRVTP